MFHFHTAVGGLAGHLLQTCMHSPTQEPPLDTMISQGCCNGGPQNGHLQKQSLVLLWFCRARSPKLRRWIAWIPSWNSRAESFPSLGFWYLYLDSSCHSGFPWHLLSATMPTHFCFHIKPYPCIRSHLVKGDTLTLIRPLKGPPLAEIPKGDPLIGDKQRWGQ